jgi:hypothetical protein
VRAVQRGRWAECKTVSVWWVVVFAVNARLTASALSSRVQRRSRPRRKNFIRPKWPDCTRCSLQDVQKGSVVVSQT